MKNPWYTTHGWLRSKELGQFSGHVVARRARARLTQLVHLAPWIERRKEGKSEPIPDRIYTYIYIYIYIYIIIYNMWVAFLGEWFSRFFVSPVFGV